MKVLMIASWYPVPGRPLLGTFFREQAQLMKSHGLDVAIIYVRVGADAGEKTGLHYTLDEGIPTYTYIRYNLTPACERGRCMQRSVMMKRAYKQLESHWGTPDVVNLRSSLHGYEAISLCKKHHLPMFFMEHSSYVMTEPDDSPAIMRLAAVIRFAEVNACVSSAVQKVMLPFSKHVRIIHDPVDSERFLPEPSTGIASGQFMFRAMGQLRAVKGYDVLLKAFAAAKNLTSLDIQLEIAGSGAQKDTLQDMIYDLNIGDCCRLVGVIPRENAVSFINGCDCFVCSSRIETLSCVLTESAACGKPVISTACGGPQDIVTQDTGVLVPPDDPCALADAMIYMTKNAANYNPVMIRKQALERFGSDVIVKQLIRACADAVKS